MVKVGFFNKILNVNRLIHVDVKVAIMVSDVGEFNAKEVRYFALEVDLVGFAELFFKFLFDDSWIGTKIDEVVYEKAKVEGRFTWDDSTMENTGGIGTWSEA